MISRIINYLLFLLCLSTSAFAQPREEDPVQVLEREPAMLLPFYAKDRLKEEDLKDQRVFGQQADTKVRNAIIRLLRKHQGNFDAVVSATLGTVLWREWPENATYDKQMDFELGRERFDQRLQVNYRTWYGDDGTTLLLLQNSFWGSKYSHRVAPITYTIIMKDGALTTAPLGNLTDNSQIDWYGTDRGYFFLGFSPDRDGLPQILILDGPSGRRQVSRFTLFSYSPEEKAWIAQGIAEEDKVDFFFDEEKGILDYSADGWDEETKQEVRKHYLYTIGSESPVEVDEEGNPVPTPTPTPEIPQEQPAQ